MSREPEACDACLRRAWLLSDLSGHLEKAVADTPGQRASELLALDDRGLAAALAKGDADRFVAEAGSRVGEELRAHVVAAGLWACCAHGSGYPTALLDDPQAPAALFGRGDPGRLALLGEIQDAVTVVGARRPSAYGHQVAESLGRELATAGLLVVSGMAMGVDSRAHQGALSAGAVTVAVLGSGADVPSPARLRRLYDSIVDTGMVLSELPPGTSARRWTFPARNRIMAALSAMTVVVEARERSGSLITTTMASDLGREVGAVPGRVGNTTSAGANALLRDGAHVVRGGQDVLDSLLGAGVLAKGRDLHLRAGPALADDLASILAEVERGVSTQDGLSAATGLGAGETAAAVARLELLGYLCCGTTGRIERSPLALSRESTG